MRQTIAQLRLRARWSWRRVQRFLKYRVLHVDDTPHRIALGVALGVFVAFTPTIGFQMILLVPLCAMLRANKVVGLPFVWITNPLTLVPIYYPCYRMGLYLTGARQTRMLHHWNQLAGRLLSGHLGWLERLMELRKFVGEILWPLWLGCLIVALVGGALAYALTRTSVIRLRRRLELRRLRRAQRAALSAAASGG